MHAPLMCSASLPWSLAAALVCWPCAASECAGVGTVAASAHVVPTPHGLVLRQPHLRLPRPELRHHHHHHPPHPPSAQLKSHLLSFPSRQPTPDTRAQLGQRTFAASPLATAPSVLLQRTFPPACVSLPWLQLPTRTHTQRVRPPAVVVLAPPSPRGAQSGARHPTNVLARPTRRAPTGSAAAKRPRWGNAVAFSVHTRSYGEHPGTVRSLAHTRGDSPRLPTGTEQTRGAAGGGSAPSATVGVPVPWLTPMILAELPTLVAWRTVTKGV